MTIDKVTLQDLSFFKGEINIFSLITRCTTQAGTEVLRHHILHPPATFQKLLLQQESVKFWSIHEDKWPAVISNGTLVMIEKFFETAEAAHLKPNAVMLLVDSILQKLFNKNEYSFVRFSLSHIIDLLDGCYQLTQLLPQHPPEVIKSILEEMQHFLNLPLCREILHTGKDAPQKKILWLSYRIRRELRHAVIKMMAAYAQLDALHSMAKAGMEHGWNFPEISSAENLMYKAEKLCHPLLKQAKAYSIELSKEKNFMFLTGANMSGKSTLIRALGVGAVFAHIGMAVPADKMAISFLEGIISNMQVEDNILKGESYFFAEVERMKTAAEKLNRHPYNLVLMDELFKGTNVHDAYECTRAVIEGLMEQGNNLMALSTHLYELSEHLKNKEKITFKYFHTDMDSSGNYHFTYQLKDGVSNDRIGFLVMKKEGVLDLLKKKSNFDN